MLWGVLAWSAAHPALAAVACAPVMSQQAALYSSKGRCDQQAAQYNRGQMMADEEHEVAQQQSI